MRISSALTLLVAGAGLAIEQVSASPIRVVVVSSHQELSASGPGILRIGHAATNAHPEIALAQMGTKPQLMATTEWKERHARPQRLCGKLREKALAMSNGIRKMLGMPLVEGRPFHHAHHMGTAKDGGNNTFKVMGWVEKEPTLKPVEAVEEEQASAPQPEEPKGRIVFPGHRVMRCRSSSFLKRIHRALMSLGPWEGRAVAFVLGCGIGVIFRMIWVMTLVTYRLIKGRREPEEYEYEIVYEQDAEDLLVPPPQYTDEKVEAVDAKTAPSPAPATQA